MSTLRFLRLVPLLAALSVGGCHKPIAVDGSGDLGVDTDGSIDQGGFADGDVLSGDADLGPGTLDVEPSTLQTITVSAGAMTPVVAFTATWNGQPVTAAWTVDRGDIASLPTGTSAMTTVTPRGTTGGLVTLIAGVNGQTVKRTVQVNLTATQNGADPTNTAEAPQIATTVASLTAGGGIGGVGGEGLGVATDPATTTALGAPTSDGSAQGLKYLYPYNGTVWPRGMLAPLVMWDWSTGDADAIEIDLKTTSGSFSYKGTFARPAILAQTGGKFVRHPIPQDVWAMATNSAGGADQLTVSVTVAKGGVSYGPISETWTIATGRLNGIIYYNSYGTQLVKTESDAVGGDKKFGGGVLSIHVGDTAPALAAGQSTGTNAGCRVCHSVSADGSRLVAQHGDSYGTSSDYDVALTGITEHTLAHDLQFAGIYPDGSMALSRDGSLVPLPNDSTAIDPTTSGLAVAGSNFGPPSFSPSGVMLAVNAMSSSTDTKVAQKLQAMSFDPATSKFGPPVVVSDYSGDSNTNHRPGWPSFLPDSKSIVYHRQIAPGNDGADGAMYTRSGAHSQIEWTNTTDATHVTTLNQLNGLDSTGTSYLPKLATASTLSCSADGNAVGQIDNAHADDAHLNYEPTVNPVSSGGYAWVVFTSRRMYGNEAVIPPFCSDPRGVDLVQNITTKKIWVSAIDLSGTPGTDASHPGFYLPAQELLAGNSRAYWVQDPCKADGISCETGDQCCNGYCEPNGANGALVCSNTPPQSQCSMVQEKCASAADCCDTSNLCVNGFCSVSSPPIF